LSKAIDGFIKFKAVEGLSDATLLSYRDHLDRILFYIGDLPIEDIKTSDIEDFLFWLKTDYVPRRITGNKRPLAPKTIYNFWVSMKTLFGWAG
jgi:integrase/recombinase XerD